MTDATRVCAPAEGARRGSRRRVAAGSPRRPDDCPPPRTGARARRRGKCWARARGQTALSVGSSAVWQWYEHPRSHKDLIMQLVCSNSALAIAMRAGALVRLRTYRRSRDNVVFPLVHTLEVIWAVQVYFDKQLCGQVRARLSLSLCWHFS